MENQRFLLYFTLFFVSYMLWSQWQIDYAPAPVAPISTTEETVPEAASADDSQQAEVSTAKNIPEKTASPSQKTIRVITDVLDIEIDTRGGDIRKAVLRQYAIDAKEPDIKFVLLDDTDTHFYIAQSGLVSSKKESAPTHNAIFDVENDIYRLAEGQDVIDVPMFWKGPDGITVKKLFRFYRGSYTADLSFDVNAGSGGWSGSQYLQLKRTRPSSDEGSAFIHTYTGGVIYNDEIKYEKIDFDDMDEENLKMSLVDGWLAMIQHYFLTAWIPESSEKNLYYSRQPRGTDQYILGVRGPAKKIEKGGSVKFDSRIVIGPKLQDKLEKITPGLELTVDYGVLTIIAKPLFWLLEVFHGWVGNWGWAIIMLTVSVKALFYKLSEMSYRSMAKMRKVTPRIQAMKERYGDDKQAMSRAMMDMYKREKINPLGGCFPILVQMPVFISLYWVLLESVEMRQAPFILWLDNLSAIDPYFILPILMGVTMFIQQKLNPAPIDPMQAKVFQVMPFAFTIMFAFFPSGLVLYWVVNNILSIIQQYVITRRIESA